MIKANKLRIGNWLDNEGEPTYIESVNTFVTVCSHPWNFAPIPLTEEWLMKFGFQKLDFPAIGGPSYVKGFSLKLNSHEDLVYDLVDGSFCVDSAEAKGAWMETPIEYVHQLQNLFFVLTGEELTIKELAK